jgi:hypothetical protein
MDWLLSQGGYMVTQGLDSRYSTDSSKWLSNFNQNSKLNQRAPNESNSNSSKIAVSSQSYSSKSLSLEIKTEDGDSVSLSFESIEFQKKMIEVESSGNKKDMPDMVSYIKEQLKGVFLGNYGKSDNTKADDLDSIGKAEKLQVPEYWNAENTSQRIVDFTVSFFGKVDLSNDKFLSAAKDAISQGFEQAKKMLGDLPDDVSNLIGNTFDLVMKKLDTWAQENGLAADKEISNT